MPKNELFLLKNCKNRRALLPAAFTSSVFKVIVCSLPSTKLMLRLHMQVW